MQRSIKKNVSDLWQLLLRDRLRLTIFGSSADELQQRVLCIVLMLASSVAIPTVDILFTMFAAHIIKTIGLRAAGRRLHSTPAVTHRKEKRIRLLLTAREKGVAKMSAPRLEISFENSHSATPN